MLDVFKLVIVYFFTTFSYVCLSLNACQTEFSYLHHANFMRPEAYADKITKSKDVQEIIRLIVEFSRDMKLKGYEIPCFKDLLEHCRDEAMEMGCGISDELFDGLCEEFEAYDYSCSTPTFELMKHKKKKHKKEVEFSTDTALGFIKFLSGSLMCIIPIPIIQAAGGALAVIGLSEIVTGAKEDGQKNSEERLDANRRVDEGLTH